MNKKKKIFIGFILFIILILIFKIIITTQYKEHHSSTTPIEKEYTVYYLLNIDGMKGLGHSALMLVDNHENGLFYSYNGMQYSLVECLVGKAGIGKMKMFDLTSDEVEKFLSSGNLEVSDVSECDNFDRLSYKYITAEEYNLIKNELDYYITIADKYEQLYADAFNSEGEEKQQAEKNLQEFVELKNVPKYQIYNHNCDTVARESIATVDNEMLNYNKSMEKLTPSANYKNMYKNLDYSWGFIHMGQDTFLEKLLWYVF